MTIIGVYREVRLISVVILIVSLLFEGLCLYYAEEFDWDLYSLLKYLDSVFIFYYIILLYEKESDISYEYLSSKVSDDEQNLSKYYVLDSDYE